MDADTHLLETTKFAKYPGFGQAKDGEFMYLALGLNGEAGEVAEKIKKAFRDGEFEEEDLWKELGDVYWYLNQLCRASGTTPHKVMQLNYDKLSSRFERDKIGGSGDNR